MKLLNQHKPTLGIFFFFFSFSCLVLLFNPEKFTYTAAASSLFTLSNETDWQALLAIKSQINDDPSHILDSWNASLHFCKWHGLSCGRKHQRVTSLKLVSHHLTGTLSPYVGNLSFLRVIDLGDNNFRSIIPQEIGRLPRLQQLILLNNSFEGYIPTNLTHCSSLQEINLVNNHLIGGIPTELGSLPRIRFLGLSINNLGGFIPPALGNLSYLDGISLAQNNLEGSIPDDLGRLTNLEFVQLSANKLSSKIPISLYNISSLQYLSISSNLIQGKLPHDFGSTLPKLQFLSVASNYLSGPIPQSLANASRLAIFDITKNKFTNLPSNLGTLRHLNSLYLSFNPLFATSKSNDHLRIFRSLTNCTQLTWLIAVKTNLTGIFPNFVTNLSTDLAFLSLFQNSLFGSIPQDIGNLINLEVLDLGGNYLWGSIPDSIRKLTKLQLLDIQENNMSGKIPDSIGNATLLNALYLSINMLEGNIPTSLGNCKFLNIISLSDNNLTGAIPEQVLSLPSLSIGLFLGRNHLTGPLPQQVGNLINIGQIDVTDNKLRGEIPSTLGSCSMLEYLGLSKNHFEGTIPSSFEQLRGLQELDLSYNNLSGKIPQFLGKLSGLTRLNLSFNDFEGQVPYEGIFLNSSAFSISGNEKLCGGIQQLQLPSCPALASRNQRKHFAFKVILPSAIGVLVCFVLLSTLMYRRRQRKLKNPSSSTPTLNQFIQLSFGELVLATNGFSSENLIGNGSFGCVYKGTLIPGGEFVAVKVFNMNVRGANKSFLAECQALKNLRHRNLLRILSCCSSIDSKGNDFKALVYEFLRNGNLDSWLHQRSPIRSEGSHNLNLIQRCNIAIDVANALDYLHHHCEEPVVHCDLKPSNILLDDNFTAHVGDFGLAKFLLATTVSSSHSEASSIGIRGTVGYVAPEYGMTREVSTPGDVYSYGVILLELFIGKRPTDRMFNENLSIHDYVEMALINNEVMQIVDPELVSNEVRAEQERIASIGLRGGSSNNQKIKEFLTTILRIGVTCSADSPRERMDISDALKELHASKKLLASYTGRR